MPTNENPLTALSDAMAAAVEKAGAATVMVDARRRMPASGIVFRSNLILTADHVVEREDDIRILLPNGSQAGARLAGRDPGSDLALLQTEGDGLAVAEAASQAASIGQLVLALGRPSNEGIQASLGVVSAVGGPVRTGRGGLLEHYLRTDTIPYPGFSGGPLISTAGQVLGLNTSGLARGVSLTIPVPFAWQVAEFTGATRIGAARLFRHSQPAGGLAGRPAPGPGAGAERRLTVGRCGGRQPGSTRRPAGRRYSGRFIRRSDHRSG